MPSLIDILNALKLLPVKLTAAQWEGMRADIRERAFFMALVDEAHILQEHRDAVKGMIGGSLSKTEVREAIGDYLASEGYQPPEGKEGTIQDLRTVQRQNLVLETNQAMVAGYAQQELFRGSVAFPAQRLVRIAERVEKRDWPSRWREAYALVGGEGASAQEMVALNDSPIWTALSRFDLPYPPYDYNSGMGRRPVSWDDARRLGLVKPEDAAAIAAQGRKRGSMNFGLQASAAGLDADVMAQVAVLSGGRAVKDGKSLVWKGGQAA